MLSRRTLLAIPALAACSRRSGGGYNGYAFIANQDGQSLAVIDLEVMAVARHIATEGSPTQVLAAATRPTIYALIPEPGLLLEVQFNRLSIARKLNLAPSAMAMALAPDEKSLFVLTRQPRSLTAVNLDLFQPSWSVPLPTDCTELALSPDGRFAALSGSQGLWLADLPARSLRSPLLDGEFGAAIFRADSNLLIAANRGARMLSLIEPISGRLVTHLPLPLRPDYFCMSQDTGQLFVTGEGMDGVVIMYPYQTEIAETVLAGRAPGAMAASDTLLFVVSPQAGDTSILDINSRKVIAVVQVGSDPESVVVTPDNRYALVLNRKSGDVAVLRASTAATKSLRWTLLTFIPVGEKPVSAAIRGA